MLAKAGLGKDGYALIPILVCDKHAPGKGVNRAFNRANMDIGDEYRDAGIVQQRVDITKEHNIGGSKQLFH